MKAVTAANLVEIELDEDRRLALIDAARETITLAWFGRTLQVRSNQRLEIEALAKRYRCFLTTGEPDLIVCAIGSTSQETLIFVRPGKAYRYPDPLRRPGLIAFLTDAVVQHAFFAENPQLMSFHAAALRAADTAFAISAVSTGGKSTTAFACARRGMSLYSDERCVLSNGCVHPFPRAVNVRAGGIELLISEDVPNDNCIAQALRAHAGKDLEAAQFRELLGDRPLPDPAPLEFIFFIAGKAHVPAVVPLELGAALAELLGAGFCGPPPGMDRLAAATQLLRQARAYGLTLGTPDDTAMLIAATVLRRRPLFAVASQ